MENCSQEALFEAAYHGVEASFTGGERVSAGLEDVAQLVEHRTFNPLVQGSTPCVLIFM